MISSTTRRGFVGSAQNSLLEGREVLRPVQTQHEPSQIRKFCGIDLPVIGLGTYLGSMDEATDLKVVKAGLAYSDFSSDLSNGKVYVDTAINYRGQRAERAVSEMLRRSILMGKKKREDFFISTKGGFVPFEGLTRPDLKKIFFENYVEKGLAEPQDLIRGCHCIAPHYLESQIDMSLRNLQVETIDLYYLHNPEMQLEELPGRVFEENLLLAFCVLERAVSQNKIKAYGLATWNGLRDEPTAQTSIQLERCVEIAQQAALKEGRSMSSFKAIQLPFNFAMPEAALLKTQKISHHEFSAFDAAQMLGLDVAVSVPLLQGQLCHQLPPFIADFFPEHFSQAHMALAFATGFGPVQNALVGMKEVDHLRHNLEFLSCPRIPQEKLVSLVRALLGRHSQ